MPLVTWDKAFFDLCYDSNAEPWGHVNTRNEVRLHYHRAVMWPIANQRADKFIELLSLTVGQSIALIGCGFGWTAEALNNRGYTCIGVDVSSYIQADKSVSEDADIQLAVQDVGLDPLTGDGATVFALLRGDGVRTRATILNQDTGTVQGRNAIKQALGGKVDIIITEDVLTSLTDAECVQSSTALNKLTNNVVHFVTENANAAPPFGFNSKTLELWKALLLTDVFIADGSFRIL